MTKSVKKGYNFYMYYSFLFLKSLKIVKFNSIFSGQVKTSDFCEKLEKKFLSLFEHVKASKHFKIDFI